MQALRPRKASDQGAYRSTDDVPSVGHLHVYTPGTLRRPRLPVGAYDQTILCADCDQFIGQFDDVAARTLKPWPRRRDFIKDDAGFSWKGNGTKHLGYLVRRPDVRGLQRFAASLLWRAGSATRPEMSLEVPEIVLNRAKQALLAESDAEPFDVLVTRFQERKLSEFVSAPVTTEPPIPGYQFCMNGLVLTILTTRFGEHGQPANPIYLGRAADWAVGFASFWGSKHERTLREIADLEDGIGAPPAGRPRRAGS